jgi:hypothetical protein
VICRCARAQAGVEVPEGESLVRVPIELLVEAMNSLTRCESRHEWGGRAGMATGSGRPSSGLGQADDEEPIGVTLRWLRKAQGLSGQAGSPAADR